MLALLVFLALVWVWSMISTSLSLRAHKGIFESCVHMCIWAKAVRWYWVIFHAFTCGPQSTHDPKFPYGPARGVMLISGLPRLSFGYPGLIHHDWSI